MTSVSNLLERPWSDTTELFQNVKKDLAKGQMIHNENFNLNEAMSALEMFDAKMDGGVDAANMKTVRLRIEEGSLPDPNSFTPTQLCSIIDELMCREVEFFYGESLAETVFSNVYTLDVNRLTGVFGAYTRVTLYTCGLVHRHIVSAQIGVEEDFVPSTHGIDLTNGGEPLNQARVSLLAELDKALDVVKDNAELTLRLKIRRATFLAWSLLDEAIVAHRPQLLDAIAAFEQAQTLIEELRVSVADPKVEAYNYDDHKQQEPHTTVVEANEAHQRTAHANDTSVLHRAVTSTGDAAVTDDNDDAADALLAKVFDVRYACRLMPPFPPRQVRRRGPATARRLYVAVLSECLDVLRGVWRTDKRLEHDENDRDAVAALLQLGLPLDDTTDLHLVVAQLWRASAALSGAMTARRSCVVSRALLVRQLLPSKALGGRVLPVDSTIGSIAALWQSISANGAASLAQQVAQCGANVDSLQLYYDMLGKVDRNVATFRCNEATHQRRNVAGALDDFAALQQRFEHLKEQVNASKVPPAYRAATLTTLERYLIDRTCDALALHAELGLVQQLHEPWELPAVIAHLMSCYAGRADNIKTLRIYAGRLHAYESQITSARNAVATLEPIPKKITGRKRRQMIVARKEQCDKLLADAKTHHPTMNEIEPFLPPPTLDEQSSLASYHVARGIFQLLCMLDKEEHNVYVPREKYVIDKPKPKSHAPAPAVSAAPPSAHRPRRRALARTASPFVSEKTQYERRFTKALCVSKPTPITFDEFSALREKTKAIADKIIVLAATREFNAALELLEQREAALRTQVDACDRTAPQPVAHDRLPYAVLRAELERCCALKEVARRNSTASFLTDGVPDGCELHVIYVPTCPLPVLELHKSAD